MGTTRSTPVAESMAHPRNMTLDFNLKIGFNMNSVVNVTWYSPWHIHHPSLDQEAKQNRRPESATTTRHEGTYREVLIGSSAHKAHTSR